VPFISGHLEVRQGLRFPAGMPPFGSLGTPYILASDYGPAQPGG